MEVGILCDRKDEIDEIKITGTKGVITFPCFDKKEIKLIIADKLETFSFENPENISYFLVEEVVGALLGAKECVSTKYSAARTSKVLEEIVSSYYKS